jgi:nitrate reductase cytochrome c-type subunit
MDIKKEEYEMIEETPEVSSRKRDQRIDIKYEEGYDPPAVPVIICEYKVSSVTNVSRGTEKYTRIFLC